MVQTSVGWGLFIQELCLFVCFKPVQMLSVQLISSNLQFAACIRLLVSASITQFSKLNVVLIWQNHRQASVCSHKSYLYLLNPVSVGQVLNLIRTIYNFTASKFLTSAYVFEFANQQQQCYTSLLYVSSLQFNFQELLFLHFSCVVDLSLVSNFLQQKW